jgi:hypothetical protein
MKPCHGNSGGVVYRVGSGPRGPLNSPVSALYTDTISGSGSIHTTQIEHIHYFNTK